MDWWNLVEHVKPHVVQISTPRGLGSGFFISYSASTDFCAVATAAHVVNDSHWWEEPIRLYHPSSGETRILRHSDRVIQFEHAMDTAAIMFKRENFPLPKKPVSVIPEGKVLKIGYEVGWLGFPAISITNLCFFTGRVSAWLKDQGAYLVDGVSINGVSGGPTFAILQTPTLIGVVSAYVPNRATGEALPGLSIVRHVRQFQELAKRFHSLDEAVEKQKETPPQPPQEKSK